MDDRELEIFRDWLDENPYTKEIIDIYKRRIAELEESSIRKDKEIEQWMDRVFKQSGAL